MNIFWIRSVRKKKKLNNTFPRDVGRLRFEVCPFLCKEEFNGTPHEYKAYYDPYLMDERARWVEIFTGHDF